MADEATPLHFENFSYAQGVHLGHQTINVIAGNQYLSKGSKNIVLRLNPIFDASHTRDLRRFPPNSACLPGTRKTAIGRITSWVDTEIVIDEIPVVHIHWCYGFAGCGKSAVSLEIAKIYVGHGRLLASYFFHYAGDRRRMQRFAATLAAQMALVLPATASFIEDALNTEPGLLDQSVSVQMQRLVYDPFRFALEQGPVPSKGPFLIVVDGIDECEDKQGVVDFIDQMLDFFATYPTIPLRFFIASRVEEYIRTRLTNKIVRLFNLANYNSDGDIELFLRASFQSAANDRIIQSYVRVYGEWPTKTDMKELVRAIKGSFFLASRIFEFIVRPATDADPSTPMERLPLALKMNCLDSLYAQTLARAQHLPHFRNVISTVALTQYSIPIVGIAHLLGMESFEVVHVLVDLQAIIHLPATDEDDAVMVCHESFRDFLTTESRSGALYVPLSRHLYLSYHAFASIFERSNGPAREYGVGCYTLHWQAFVEADTCDFVDEIEQFKAQTSHSLYANRTPYHAFLCSVFFVSLTMDSSQTSVGSAYALPERARQLAFAAECSSRHHIRLWLGKGLTSNYVPPREPKTWQITKSTFKALQRNLQRASAAIHAKYPDVLDPQLRSSESSALESKYLTRQDFNYPSGREIFDVLEWIVARAQIEWEELEATPRPPLHLGIEWEYPWISIKFK